MVDRPSTATMRRRMYVPEERPDYEAYIADPENQQQAQDVALNLATLALGPLGEIPAGIRLAKNLYSGYRGLDRLMPRSDRGNAMLPEEMLQVEGPPARAALPKPSRPQMTEEEMQAMEIARMVGEGGPSFSKQEAARREVRRRPSEEEMRANEVARMEGEGGIDPAQAAFLRAIKEQREEALRAEDIARFEGEGGGAWNYSGPRYKYGLPATQGPREVINYGSSNTLPTLAGGRGGGDLISPSLKFFREEEARALPPPSGNRTAGFQSAGEGPSMGGFSNFKTNIPYKGQGPNIVSAALPLTVGASMLPGAGVPAMEPAQARPPIDEVEFQYRKPVPIDDVEIQYGISGRAPAAATSGSSGSSSSSGSAPAPAAKQSTGDDIRALWTKYNESGNMADFIRADRAMKEAGAFKNIKPEGEKRGGSVEKKPDAVHKALEIIHHLVMR
jgi:hypothetical protein